MDIVKCARIHVRKCDSKITEFYRKLKRKGKHENVAIIGAARKENHFVAKNTFLSFSTVVLTTWVLIEEA